MNINNYMSKLTLKFKNPNAEREYNVLRDQNILRFCKWFAFVYIIASFVDILFTFISVEKAEKLGKKNLIDDAWIFIILSSSLSFISIIITFYCKNIKIQKSMGYIIFLAIGYPYYHSRLIAEDVYSEVSDILFLIKFFEISTRSMMIFCEIIIFVDSIYVCATTLVATVIFHLHHEKAAKCILSNVLILMFHIFLSYFKTKCNKEKLFYLWDLNVKNRYKNIFENMKSYFLYFSNKQIKFLNHIFVETLMKNKEIKNIPRVNTVSNNNIILDTEYKEISKYNRNKNSNCKIFDHNKKAEDDQDTLFLKENSEEVLKIILKNINHNEIIEEIESCDSFLSIGNKLNIFSLEEFLSNTKEIYFKNELKENFMFLGYKEMLISTETDGVVTDYKKKKFEVYFRTIIREDEEFELIFNDISEIKSIEEKSAELKYKSLFLSKVAHEFKNPLICISELSNEIKTLNRVKHKKSTYINKSCELIDKIHSMSDYLLILIKDLDYFSNIQIKKDPPSLEIEEVGLTRVFEFCKQIADILIIKSNKKKLNFIIQNDLPKDIKLKTDEVKLKQILINLISNSIKFSYDGCVKLITSIRKEKDVNVIFFEVQDTGIGLEPEQIELLGNPFIKGRKSQNSYGTGLGIYIVSQMLKQLGSEIKCTSEIGKGTSFSFKLQVENSQIDTYSECMNRSHSPSLNSSFATIKLNDKELILDENHLKIARSFLERKKLKSLSLNNININKVEKIYVNSDNSNINITTECSDKQTLDSETKNTAQSYFIIVDDEKFTRRSTLRVLKQNATKLNLNINFLEAEDGIECLSLVYNLLKEGKKINGIISDEMMNHMNGSTTAEIFKKIKNFNTQLIPFFLLSALNDINNNYVDYFITKPLVEKEAIKILKNELR